MAKQFNTTKYVADKANALITSLDKLAAAREEFEATDLARTNQQLYKILAEIYGQYLTAAKDKAMLQCAVAAMKAKLVQQGQRVQSNTQVLSLFVRYVFNTDRQRIFNYTRAIQAAISNGHPPEELANFITTAGGVEECKKKAPPLSTEVIEKARTVESTMPLVEEVLLSDSTPCLAEFKVDPTLVASVWDKGMTFLVGRSDAKGNVEVRGVIPASSAAFEKWAKTQLALFLAQQKQANDKAEKAQRKEKAIAQAVASARPVSANATVTVAELEAA